MQKYKHTLIFDYFGNKQEREVDDLFSFSVRYFNKYSRLNTVKESERTIVPWGVTEIHLLEKEGADRLIYKINGTYVDMTYEIESLLHLQYKSISLKMLFHAILDNCSGFRTSMRLSDISTDYSHIVF